MSLDMVLSEPEYLAKVLEQKLPFCYMREGIPYRVQSTPVAVTSCSMDGSGKGWFELRVPRIPQYILMALYMFFEQVADMYETEVRVQCFYDSVSKEYTLYLPRQEVTSMSVYTLEAEYAYMSDQRWPVLDIHSHCRFPAMWSLVDNANELGNWVFGVIGSIGHSPKMHLRVGTGGNFMDVDQDIIFDLSITNDVKARFLAERLFAETKEKLSLVENH